MYPAELGVRSWTVLGLIGGFVELERKDKRRAALRFSGQLVRLIGYPSDGLRQSRGPASWAKVGQVIEPISLISASWVKVGELITSGQLAQILAGWSSDTDIYVTWSRDRQPASSEALAVCGTYRQCT